MKPGRYRMRMNERVAGMVVQLLEDGRVLAVSHYTPGTEMMDGTEWLGPLDEPKDQ